MSIQEYRELLLPHGPTIHAVEVTAENVKDVAEWCGGTVVDELNPFDKSKKTVGINVPVLHGNMRASEGYFVILNIGGGFDVVTGAWFRANYTLDKPREEEIPDCRICQGSGGNHDGSVHDARVADMPPAVIIAEHTRDFGQKVERRII